ncbi:MAG: hypothetical protein J6O49_21950, partial [Bacteroidaceae bacterium]|nr:hypothetical protein [Bacteroidaceae bacterium]
MKKVIRLTENYLHRIVKESVSKILKETMGAEPGVQNDSFTIAMNKLYTLLKDEVGGDSMR